MPKGPNYGALDPAIPLEPVDDIDAATPDLERFYLQRLRSLRAVDEMLDAMCESQRSRRSAGPVDCQLSDSQRAVASTGQQGVRPQDSWPHC